LGKEKVEARGDWEEEGDTEEIKGVIEGLCPSIENISPFPLSRGRGIQGDGVTKRISS